MTLSQRLTRAGLTFILLGSVAAVLPQQGGAAIAANPCTTPPPVQLEIRQQSTRAVSSVYNQPSSSNQSYDAYISSDSGGSFSPDANGVISYTNSGDAVISPASGTSQTAGIFIPASTSGGTVNLTATDSTTSANTYVATATVTYQ